MTPKVLTTQAPLTFRQALAILANISVSYGPFEDDPFLALVKRPYNRPLPSPEELCDLIVRRNVETLATAIQRTARQDRKAARRGRPKMKAWSLLQRRGLLSGQRRYLKAQISLHEQYQFFYQELQALAPTLPKGTRGPPQRYDRIGLSTAIALKLRHDIPWLELPTRLREAGLDLRLSSWQDPELPPVPSHQLFFTLFTQVEAAELQRWLEVTDTKSHTQLAAWKETSVPLLYAADGTGHPLQADEPCTFQGRATYRRKSLHLVLLQNLQTRTVRGLFYPDLTGQSRRDLREFIAHLPPGAILLADPEFDVEYLQQAAREAGVTLHAKPNVPEGAMAASPLRREAHTLFDRKLYRRRKLQEAIFAILARRGILVPRRSSAPLAARAAVWACVGQNLDCLLNLELYPKLFNWVDWPQPAKALAILQLADPPTPTSRLARQEATTSSPDRFNGDPAPAPALEPLPEREPKLTPKPSPVPSPIPAAGSEAGANRRAPRAPPPAPQAPDQPQAEPASPAPPPPKAAPTPQPLLQWSQWLFSDPVARKIVGCLLQLYPGTPDRTRLAQLLDIARSTLYDAIQRLCLRDVVMRVPPSTGQRGRPRTRYTLVYPASDRGPPGAGS